MMSKALIAQVIRTQCRVSVRSADAAAAEIVDLIIGCVKHDGYFNLPKLGSLETVEVPRRRRRNPTTGKSFMAPATSRVRFVTSQTLRAELAAARNKRRNQRKPASVVA